MIDYLHTFASHRGMLIIASLPEGRLPKPIFRPGGNWGARARARAKGAAASCHPSSAAHDFVLLFNIAYAHSYKNFWHILLLLLYYYFLLYRCLDDELMMRI